MTNGGDGVDSYVHHFKKHVKFQDVHAVVIVCAIDAPWSFKKVSNYISSVSMLCPADTIKVLVGAKCDLDEYRKVKS